jgi:hypothetical protein
VAVTTDHGTSTMRVSAVSFVYACLDQPSSQEETNAVATLYSYYAAADSYKKANPRGKNYGII